MVRTCGAGVSGRLKSWGVGQVSTKQEFGARCHLGADRVSNEPETIVSVS